MGGRNDAAKFQSVWFGNASAVRELPQLGHRSHYQIGRFAGLATIRHQLLIATPTQLYNLFFEPTLGITLAIHTNKT